MTVFCEWITFCLYYTFFGGRRRESNPPVPFLEGPTGFEDPQGHRALSPSFVEEDQKEALQPNHFFPIRRLSAWKAAPSTPLMDWMVCFLPRRRASLGGLHAPCGWDLRTHTLVRATPLTSSLYLYCITTGSGFNTRKLHDFCHKLFFPVDCHIHSKYEKG